MVSIFICHLVFALAQTKLNFSYCLSPAFTFSRTIESENNTWGYSTPAHPNTAVNSFDFGFTFQKNKLTIQYEIGSLGINYRVKTRPHKYPMGHTQGDEFDLPGSLQINERGMTGTALNKISFIFQRELVTRERLTVGLRTGVALMKTRIDPSSISLGGGANIPDSVGVAHHISDGWIHHRFGRDVFAYINTENVYLLFGLNVSLILNKSFDLSFRFDYNQGARKMVYWHTYREYYESNTSYTEYDDQWSYSRLSYLTAGLGISYNIILKNGK